VILIAGLQMYGFYRYFIPDINIANQNLDRLMNEVVSNQLTETMLGGLEDLQRLTDDESFRSQIRPTYEKFIASFLKDPRVGLDEFEGVLATFPVQSNTLANDALSVMKWDLSRLREIYSDNYGELNSSLESPPMYLQPAASFLKRTNDFEQKVKYNHALYLSIVGDRSAANIIFNDLKQEVVDPEFLSVVYYAQGRMLFSSFQSEGRVEYYLQAIQSLQQSLHHDPGFGMSKLFLEYLLSLLGGGTAESVPSEGDGSGEAQGKRGMISSQPPTF